MKGARIQILDDLRDQRTRDLQRGWFRHNDLRVNHLGVQIVTFTSTDASNHGYGGICLSDVVDNLPNGHAPSNVEGNLELNAPETN